MSSEDGELHDAVTRDESKFTVGIPQAVVVSLPVCWGCECGVPIVDGRHVEECDDQSLEYAYQCTRISNADNLYHLHSTIDADARNSTSLRNRTGSESMNNYSGNPTAAANRQARQTCGRYIRKAQADIAILSQVVTEHPGLALKELAPLLAGRCSWTNPVATIQNQIRSGLNRLGKAGIRVEHGRDGKPTRLWPEEA